MKLAKTDGALRADAERLADIFTNLQRRFLSGLSKELARGNVSFPQYFLLAFLQGSDGLTMTSIARQMDHSTAATTGLIDRLESLGLVSRAHDREDRRRVIVRITRKGSELVRGIREDMVASVLKLMEQLKPGEQRAWVDIYVKLFGEGIE